MSRGTEQRLAGPELLIVATQNIYTPSTSDIFGLIYHIRLVNVDAVATVHAVGMHVGASGGNAAATAIAWQMNIYPGQPKDVYFYGGLKLIGGTDYLTAYTDVNNKVTITVMGKEGSLDR